MEWFQSGCPLQISTDRWICAPPRGFSQLVTSFIGSRCQGIRPVLFLLDLFRDMHSVAYQAFTSFRSSSVFLQKIGSRYLLLYSVFKVQGDRLSREIRKPSACFITDVIPIFPLFSVLRPVRKLRLLHPHILMSIGK